jgi:excinuclease ABC subunit A
MYSQDNACPQCGIGFPELSPQSFSFNSPLGMCVECNGLGERMQIDPELLVPDPTLSINRGAIATWGEAAVKDTGWTKNIITALARKYKIPLDRPWNKLGERHRKLLLHGSGDDRVEVRWNGKNSEGSWAMRWEGLLAQLERRYRETSSERARQYYEGYFRAIACQSCSGTRLRPESRAVVIDDISIAQVTAMTVGDAAGHFAALELGGARAKIATEVLKEVRARLSFLLDVGLEYSPSTAAPPPSRVARRSASASPRSSAAASSARSMFSTSRQLAFTRKIMTASLRL